MQTTGAHRSIDCVNVMKIHFNAFLHILADHWPVKSCKSVFKLAGHRITWNFQSAWIHQATTKGGIQYEKAVMFVFLQEGRSLGQYCGVSQYG